MCPGMFWKTLLGEKLKRSLQRHHLGSRGCERLQQRGPGLRGPGGSRQGFCICRLHIAKSRGLTSGSSAPPTAPSAGRAGCRRSGGPGGGAAGSPATASARAPRPFRPRRARARPGGRRALGGQTDRAEPRGTPPAPPPGNPGRRRGRRAPPPALRAPPPPRPRAPLVTRQPRRVLETWAGEREREEMAPVRPGRGARAGDAHLGRLT